VAELRNVGIIGTGHYVPQKVVTNFDLMKMVDTSDEWIRTRTGIRERRIADETLLLQIWQHRLQSAPFRTRE